MAGSKLKSALKILNPLEISKSVTSEAAKQAVAGWEDTWAQIYGLQSQDHHKDQKGKKTEKPDKKEQKSVGQSVIEMLVGQEYSVNQKSEGPASSETPKKYVEPAISYHRDIVKSGEDSSRRNLSEMDRKFAQIHDELKRLVDSSNKVIQDEFGGVALESAPKEVGTYHINFLDWMLIAISTARQKVEDSGAWLSAMKSKKGKKGYWGMFKKHGTTFGMSNERNVATQTG